MIFKMDLSLLANLWNWYLQDIIGNEIVGVTIFIVCVFVGFALLRIPIQLNMIMLLPLIFGFTMLGYLTWFGWLILGLSGLMFGIYVLRIYGVM